MTIKWHLKKYLLDKHLISTATELKKIIIDKTGVSISLQNICNLMNKKPVMIRLDTMEVLCSALNCRLDDFCQISEQKKKLKKGRKLSYKNTPHSKRGISNFPNPEDY